MSLRRQVVTPTPTSTPAPSQRLQMVLQAGVKNNSVGAPVCKRGKGYSVTELRELTEQVSDYISENIMRLIPGKIPAVGDRVIEQDYGRFGITVEGGVYYDSYFHPAVIYDDDPTFTSTCHNSYHFIVVKPGAELPTPPWE